MIIRPADFAQLRAWSKDDDSFHSLLGYLAQSTQNNGFLIMHVDDDLVYLDALGHYLSCGGFRVASLNKAFETLEAIPHLRPDLIILDHYMPEMDGPSLYQKIQALPAAASVPVVFLTSSNDERIQQSRAETGALFLSKSLAPDALVSQFSDLLGSGL